MLGVIISDWRTASDHVTQLLTSCSRLLYVMRAHGLPPLQSLQDVFRATVEAKLIYVAPAWSGFCSAGDPVRWTSDAGANAARCEIDMRPVLLVDDSSFRFRFLGHRLGDDPVDWNSGVSVRPSVRPQKVFPISI